MARPRPIEIDPVYAPDHAISETVNQLMFRSKTTRIELGEALGVGPHAMGGKLSGKISWSIKDIYKVVEFFSVDLTTIMPTVDEQGRYVPVVLPIEVGRHNLRAWRESNPQPSDP